MVFSEVVHHGFPHGFPHGFLSPGGIFNMAWNPHSQLAGCSAGNYALIFAHFAELGAATAVETGDPAGGCDKLNNSERGYDEDMIYEDMVN